MEVSNVDYRRRLHAPFRKKVSQNWYLVAVGIIQDAKEVGHTRKRFRDGGGATLGSHHYIPMLIGYSAGSKKKSGASGGEHKVNLVLYNQFFQQPRHCAHIAFIIVYEHLYR